MSNKVTDFKGAANAIIRHKRFVELHNKILEQLELTALLGEPQCWGIEGPRGVGKTTLVKDYYGAYPRKIVGTKTIIPVLFVTAPRPVTIRMMAAEMLRCIGDPEADNKDDPGVINHKLIQYIREDCGTILVIIDEFQHLLEPGTDKVYFDVSDWLKYLIKATGKPFLVVGLEGKISKIIESNPQLEDLFEVETFKPFSYDIDHPETIQIFGDFLSDMEEIIQLELPWRFEEDADLVYRMHYATDGTVRSIKKLMFKAAKRANQKNAERLEMEILREVFQEQIEKGLKKKHNPFDAKWGDWFTPPRDI